MKIKNRKIMHVLFGSRVGGQENKCMDLISYLSKHKYKQILILLSREKYNVLRKIKNTPNLKIKICEFKKREYFHFVKQFFQLCKENKPKAIFIYFYGLPSFFVTVSSWYAGVKNNFIFHGNPPPKNIKSKLLCALLTQLTHPFIKTHIACSNYTANKIIHNYFLSKKKIVVICDFCDVKKISRIAKTKKRGKKLKPVIGIISRLDPIKDHANLIKAFGIFQKDYPKAKLVIIGDGVLKASLIKLTDSLGIRKKVSFLGTKNNIPKELAKLDIFAFSTTEEEGFGIVLAEAMAAELPIVATDIGPCREILGNGKAGLLVPPKNPEALSRGIERVLRNPQLYKRLLKNGFSFVSKHYDIKIAGRKIEELIN